MITSSLVLFLGMICAEAIAAVPYCLYSSHGFYINKGLSSLPPFIAVLKLTC